MTTPIEEAWPSTKLAANERAALRYTACGDCGEVQWCQFQEGDEGEASEEEEDEEEEEEDTKRPSGSHHGPHSEETRHFFDDEWVCEECYYAGFL